MGNARDFVFRNDGLLLRYLRQQRPLDTQSPVTQLGLQRKSNNHDTKETTNCHQRNRIRGRLYGQNVFHDAA